MIQTGSEGCGSACFIYYTKVIDHFLINMSDLILEQDYFNALVLDILPLEVVCFLLMESSSFVVVAVSLC